VEQVVRLGLRVMVGLVEQRLLVELVVLEELVVPVVQVMPEG
jgi:hypothetical protein